MPRTTMGGDDPDHQLPREFKERRERELREEARKLRAQGKPKEASTRVDRANHISRKPSRTAQHH